MRHTEQQKLLDRLDALIDETELLFDDETLGQDYAQGRIDALFEIRKLLANEAHLFTSAKILQFPLERNKESK